MFKALTRRTLFALALIAGITPAVAQTFPTIPDHTVIGRIGIAGQSGPSQAMPFATLAPQLYGVQSANKVNAGPVSGVAGLPTFRLLVGADLPPPGASSLGGVLTASCPSHFWLSAITNTGAASCGQPDFADLTGSIATGQIAAGTIVNSHVGASAAIALSKLAPQANNTTVCNVSGGSAVPIACTATQLTTQVNVATTGASGAVGALPNNGNLFWNGLGAYAAPPSAGQMILLNTLTASASASLDDLTSLTSTYSVYEIVLENIVPATNAVTLELLVHSGGAYQGTLYVSEWWQVANSSYTPTTSNTSSFLALSTASDVANTGGGVSGHVRIFTPSGTSNVKAVGGQMFNMSGASARYGIASGYWNSSAAIDGIRVQTSSGNITSGVIKIYGIQ